MIRSFLTSLVGIFCFTLIGCKQEMATGLTEANIRQAIVNMNAASAKFDAATICAMVDDAAIISLRQIKFSGPESSTMRKDEYCRFVSAGMQALSRSGATYETSTNVEEINIAPDGATADVKYSQTERVVAAGQTLRGSFAGNATVAWKNGRVTLTSVRGVVRFAQ
jgi:ketosteroid isomerase-like protein